MHDELNNQLRQEKVKRERHIDASKAEMSEKQKKRKKKTKPILISNKDAKLQIAWNGYMIERTVKLRASFEESEWGKQMIYVDKNAK